MTIRRRIAALATAAVMAGGVLAIAPSAAQAAPSDTQTVAGPQYYCGYYNGSATQRRGSTGNAVREIQCIINVWVVGQDPLAVDGIFGAQTEAWVRVFQDVQNIGVDGIVGPETWGRLRAV
ncbi:peptidoglycan-binding domain-containing protein [Streptomyces sp. NPDC050982]|uniref:peptidoglycan-binding domain-containing protein n=1 Tax=Streptomyces sp. NPDC050982 TaxID=3154746 RepID=UPI0033FBCD1B